ACRGCPPPTPAKAGSRGRRWLATVSSSLHLLPAVAVGGHAHAILAGIGDDRVLREPAIYAGLGAQRALLRFSEARISVLACFLLRHAVLHPAELSPPFQPDDEHQPNEFPHRMHLRRLGLRGATLVARNRTANGEIPELLLDLRSCRNRPTSPETRG